MLGDEPAAEERAQRMAEEDDRRPRLLGGDQAVQGPEVADHLVPSALVGEMAEIGGGGLGPVAAQVVGVDPVARGVERGGETGVAGAVLGEAVGDLHDRARAPFRQPAARQQALPVVGAKHELAARHSALVLPSLVVGAADFSRNLTPIRRAASSAARGRTRLGSPNFLLAESIAIG